MAERVGDDVMHICPGSRSLTFETGLSAVFPLGRGGSPLYKKHFCLTHSNSIPSEIIDYYGISGSGGW